LVNSNGGNQYSASLTGGISFPASIGSSSIVLYFLKQAFFLKKDEFKNPERDKRALIGQTGGFRRICCKQQSFSSPIIRRRSFCPVQQLEQDIQSVTLTAEYDWWSYYI